MHLSFLLFSYKLRCLRSLHIKLLTLCICIKQANILHLLRPLLHPLNPCQLLHNLSQVQLYKNVQKVCLDAIMLNTEFKKLNINTNFLTTFLNLLLPQKIPLPPFPLQHTNEQMHAWRTSDQTYDQVLPRPQQWQWCWRAYRQLLEL